MNLYIAWKVKFIYKVPNVSEDFERSRALLQELIIRSTGEVVTFT